MSKIVVGHIGPIRANRIMLGRLTMLIGAPIVQPEVEIKADLSPITRDMLEQLPHLSDQGLLDIRKYLKTDRDELGLDSSSSQKEIDSWIAMVDEEIRYRRTERRGLFEVLKSAFPRKAG